MLDDVSLARLAEMGVDVYVPRTASRGAGVAQGSTSFSGAPVTSPGTGPARARVVLLARADDARSKNLLAQVVRSFVLARIDAVVASIADAERMNDAAGFVVFGEAFAREFGAVMSADRLKKMPFVAVAEASDVAGSAVSKRALWSELRRVMRELRAGR